MSPKKKAAEVEPINEDELEEQAEQEFEDPGMPESLWDMPGIRTPTRVHLKQSIRPYGPSVRAAATAELYLFPEQGVWARQPRKRYFDFIPWDMVMRVEVILPEPEQPAEPVPEEAPRVIDEPIDVSGKDLPRMRADRAQRQGHRAPKRGRGKTGTAQELTAAEKALLAGK